MSTPRWMDRGWIPTVRASLPALDAVRDVHVPALDAYYAAAGKVAAVRRRHASADDSPRERMLEAVRAGRPVDELVDTGGLPPLQREVELQVAQEGEARAMLALCDAVSRCLAMLDGPERGALQSYVGVRVNRVGMREIGDARKVDALVSEIGRDTRAKQIRDELAEARATARAVLAAGGVGGSPRRVAA